MHLRLAAALLTLALTATGCPFLEELDASSKEMDKYSKTGRKMAEEKAKAEKEAAAKGSGGVKDFFSSKGKGGKAADSAKEAAGNWWANATSLAPDERDPDLVRCQLPGKVEFMRKHDCLMRSGLALK